MGILPCPCCGKPLDQFESRTDAGDPTGVVHVMIYVHDDHSRCQIRVPASAAASVRGPRGRARVRR